jgi:hypothetical protein
VDLRERLAEWEAFYNHHRPHGAFAGKTPYEVLRERLQCPRLVSHEVRYITVERAESRCRWWQLWWRLNGSSYPNAQRSRRAGQKWWDARELRSHTGLPVKRADRSRCRKRRSCQTVGSAFRAGLSGAFAPMA